MNFGGGHVSKSGNYYFRDLENSGLFICELVVIWISGLPIVNEIDQ